MRLTHFTWMQKNAFPSVSELKYRYLHLQKVTNLPTGILQKELQFRDDLPLLLFNGSFQYIPNREALDNLLFKVNPLLQQKEIPYLILIIGLDIPETIKNASYPNVKILGFVENLELYLTGCNVFLNPVQSGGGIKTKLVEALAFNLNAVSTENGAIGIDPALCNDKLIVCPDRTGIYLQRQSHGRSI